MEEKINRKIEELKEDIKKVTEGYPYTNREINLLTITSLSMILIDDEIEDLVLEALRNNLVVFTKRDLKTVYHKLFPNQLEWRKLKGSSAFYFGYFLSEGNLYQDHIIIVPEEKNIFFLFDNLIHELKHAINEIFPELMEIRGNISFYSGLAECSEKKIQYEAIDEAFNSYLTKIYLDNILFLKRFEIEDAEIKEILDSFIPPKKYHYAYEEIVLLCLPLFESEHVFKDLYYASLYKSFYNLDQVLERSLGHSKDSIDLFLYLDKQLKKKKKDTEIEDLDYQYLQKRVRIKPYLK